MKKSFKPSPSAVSHSSRPTRHVEITDEEVRQILALAKPANTGARLLRPKPSDLRYRRSRDLQRQYAY
jgi:hypothetical protein